MCDLNGPFKLCSCSSDIDYSKPHWILKTNSVRNEEYLVVIEGMMIPPNLIDKIERRKVLRRLNTINVFDFEYTPSENDQLELNHEEDDGYKFTFKGDKWVLEEFFGAHPVFEHGTQRDGLIESLPSKLKEVYSKYLEVLEEGEVDIVKCGWSNYRISEKKLIKLLENRVNGEKTELPEGYEPWGF
jgi:Golgi nucleoside diphosphatase